MLKEELKKSEIEAIKARDKQKVSVLRLVNADIKAYEVNERKDATDDIIIKIIEKQIKQIKETLEYSKQLNDEEKIAEGNFAINLLSPYLPEQLKDEEVEAMIREIITTNNYSKADMGKIMKEIMPKVAGRYDRSKINPMVKNILG